MKKINILLSFTLLAVLLVGLLAGCSTKKSEPDAPQPKEKLSVVELPDSSAGSASSTKVLIKGFKFVPGEITVKKGTTVTWRNEDSAPHTVESDDGQYTSDNLENSDEVQFTFDKLGKVDYHCGIHPSMKASVIVE
ncbi:cupredoxin family copper-binding protein [Candidatus Woesearchaeota archaeon]|nr:cupredoxin family copper-binding protein [Candidatus Woesearchaeota archaeon]